MAKFNGTLREFKRVIGPRLRNLVQTWTRTHKESVGACENCGSGEQLESAHVKGSDRNQIIERILTSGDSNEILTVDLTEFEEKFRGEHEPLEKAILVLCHSCHGKYDAEDVSINSSDGGRPADRQNEHARDGVLPIVLSPSPVSEFKKRLLAQKKATVEIYYTDGRRDIRPWDASEFSAASNVMRNLPCLSGFHRLPLPVVC